MDDLLSECGVATCELICKGRKDVLEFLSIEVIARAEETCTERSIVRDHSGERLCDSRLSCSCQAVEPEDVSILRIFGPSHDAVEDGLSSPPETRVVVTSLMSRIMYRSQLF